MRDEGKTHFQQCIVVDDYEPCQCHKLLVTRRMDTRHDVRVWVILLVSKPYEISFGDRIDYDADNNKAYLVRNEKLRFRLHIEKLRPEDMVAMSQSLPYGSMYDQVFLLFPTPE